MTTLDMSSARSGAPHPQGSMELVCPAGSLPALKAAVDNGADCVYVGFRDATNARNFAGLNFDDAAIADGIRYAHDRGRKVLLALNTYPQATNWQPWRAAIDRAADAGIRDHERLRGRVLRRRRVGEVVDLMAAHVERAAERRVRAVVGERAVADCVRTRRAHRAPARQRSCDLARAARRRVELVLGDCVLR